jgi:hypothetical protein
MTACRHADRRRAFSLLEVMLAAALSAIVVYLIAGAIDFHLRQLTVRKSRIEEAQLARAILRRMADDLRAVVVDRPIDFSSVSQLAQQAAGGGDAQPSDDQTSGGSAAGDGTQEDSSSASDIADSSLLPAVPGIYGNSYELQIDISRIPRYEEYAILQQESNLATLRLLSDVKTVSYFMLGQTSIGGTSSIWPTSVGTSPLGNTAAGIVNTLGLPPGQPLQGLGRRIVDRAATRFALENSDHSFLDQQTELFAPEVALVQFRYFDGQQWLTEWDTQQLQGVPLAVEIILVLQPPLEDPVLEPTPPTNATMAQSDLWQFDPEHVYRLVVNLPAAELIDSASTGANASSATTSQGGGT